MSSNYEQFSWGMSEETQNIFTEQVCCAPQSVAVDVGMYTKGQPLFSSSDESEDSSIYGFPIQEVAQQKAAFLAQVPAYPYQVPPCLFSVPTKLEHPPQLTDVPRPHAHNIYEFLVEKHRHFTQFFSAHSHGGFRRTSMKPANIPTALVRKCHVRDLLELFLDFELLDNFTPKTEIPMLLESHTPIPKKVKKKINFVKGKRSRSETGYFGVRMSTSGYRFRSTVNFRGKPYNAGTYKSVEAAAKKYDEKLLELTNGVVQPCRLNMPQLWQTRLQNPRKRPFAEMENPLTLNELSSVKRFKMY